MKPLFALSVFCLGLVLSGCGKQDVHSACFSNGDHEHMSDGKITRICDCIESGVTNQKPTEADTNMIVAWLNKKSLEAVTPERKEQAKKISAYMTQLKSKCEAIR